MVSALSSKISTLTSTAFENMVYDVLQNLGFHNLIWRTPGSDGGRDIEGTYLSKDVSGESCSQLWYIECKRYSTSIDWPTVWNKIAYADGRDADFLLIVTNSNPSPQCETEISLWNKRRHKVLVRVWRGYGLEVMLRDHPLVQAKYGLLETKESFQLAFSDLAFEIVGITQSVSVGYSLGMPIDKGLAVAAALSELVSLRMSDYRSYGKFAQHRDESKIELFDWVDCTRCSPNMYHVSLRAVLATFRYLTVADRVSVDVSDGSIFISAQSGRLPFTPTSQGLLKTVLLWSDAELIAFGQSPSSCILRPRTL